MAEIAPELIPEIISSIRYAGGRLSDEDAVHHDEDLEQIVPDLVTALLQYDDPNRVMIQIFDIITRLVEDPDINEAVREMAT